MRPAPSNRQDQFQSRGKGMGVRLGSFAKSTSLSKRFERITQLLPRRDRRRFHQTFSDESRGEIDDSRSIFPRNEFRQLDVQFGRIDQSRTDQSRRNRYVEFPLILRVNEPSGDLLGDFAGKAA